MTQKASTLSTPASNQVTHTVFIKDTNKYIGAKSTNEALDIACEYLTACSEPNLSNVSIHRGTPTEIKRRLTKNKPKVIQKAATA